MAERPLTPKEQKVVDAFEAARPGLGEVAESNIRNNDRTGWADIVADMSDEEIAAGASVGYSTNSFMYRRLG